MPTVWPICHGGTLELTLNAVTSGRALAEPVVHVTAVARALAWTPLLALVTVIPCGAIVVNIAQTVSFHSILLI